MKKDLAQAEQEVLKARIKAERAVLNDIEKQYQDALGAINSHIAQLMGRQDANLPHVIRRVEYQRLLQQQIQAAMDKLHSQEYDTVAEYLNESYKDAFVGTVYTLHHQNMPVILPINQDLAVKAITLDTKLKESLYKEMGKDINNLKGIIRLTITSGIASNTPYSEIARNISNAAGIPMRRAKTIARTEGGRVQEQASYDAALQAKEKGARLVKQWSAIRDGKTRDAHRALHNQTRELDEPFEIDGEEAMYPHDFGQAYLDCNCRCTMLTLAKAALDDDTLKQMEADADFHNLRIKDTEKYGKAQVQNLGDFKKRYLKAAEAVEKKPNVPEIKDAFDFGYGDYSSADYVKWLEAYDETNKNVHLSAKELEVIDNYTEGSFISYNAVSRGLEDSLLKQGYTKEDIVRIRKDADILEGALAKYELDTNIVTHRFERDVSWLTGNGNGVEELEKMVGTTYTATGFTSSGMLPNRFRFTGGKADAVHFEIVTPKGTNGAFLSMSKKGEEEFLYNRNTQFVVLDGGERIVKESKFNIKTMQMEEVDVKERFLKVQVVTDAVEDVAKPVSIAAKEVAKPLPKPQQVVAAKPKAAAFTPANSIEEAEKAIMGFCDDKQFGAVGVSYKGLSLDVANEINRTMIPLFQTYDTGKFGGIIAPAANTKLGKQMSGAVAGYSPVRKSFILNRKTLKDMKTAQKAFEAEVAALKDLFDHPEHYDFNKLSKQVISMLERSKVSGRATVPGSVEEAIQHEFGHFLERKVFASDLWAEAEKNMPSFADKVSGYAGSNKGEYVAESFVSFMKGEDVIDPVMARIFEGLRRE